METDSEERVLVGVCDGELDRHLHKTSFLTNKVGGGPDWSPGFPRALLRCGLCEAPLAHAVQVYCPLEASPYHRTLNVFACLGSECSGRSEGWRVLRSQSLEVKAAQPSNPGPATSASDWCESADDWGEEDDGSGEADNLIPKQDKPESGEGSSAATGSADMSSTLQELHLSDESIQAPEFRAFFISVIEEGDLDGEDEELVHAKHLLKTYETQEGVMVVDLTGEDGGSSVKEKYEKMSARHGDVTFSRFLKKISPCPEQILRYCRGSEPLFVSPPPPLVIRELLPACSSCGGTRIFELQLMPTLVSLLQRSESNSQEAPLEFGTVLVYTCKSSCWKSGSTQTVEEFCLVQTDPDQQLFK